MFRDEDTFPTSSRPVEVNIMEDDARIHANDDFDDVFGSAPSSPGFEAQEASFTSPGYVPSNDREISDIPRLKEKHQTEGYRDGVTAGKATSVQAGFDEGYSLGAVLGLRVGAVLGLLEGIFAATSKAEGLSEEKTRTKTLLDEARVQLKMENVFGGEYWGDDGIWKFEVPGEEEKEVVFPDVVSAHPLVKKWEVVVADEVQRWDLDLHIMDHEASATAGLRNASTEQQSSTSNQLVEEVQPALNGTVLGTAKKDLVW
ncbi:hypothetical protein BP6252_05768 [Coleophoma cylindrospora]|uniref:Protein YAE1 n=1 Tax=Coleophoma cylindrospora TaxID=1849047 RepID=A0A3D8RUN3_9HELO|nr:hypothetical protein BP6252_05768 [Coleophoma cylindrospora]